MDKIGIILLGGTISQTRPNKYDNSYISELLIQSRLSIEYTIYDLVAMDSIILWEMEHDLIDRIQKKILEIPENHVLILMGTDRMIQFAQSLSLRNRTKNIIITGAMIPYRQRVETDSIFNFGFSLGSLSSMRDSGVWIGFHGKLLDPFLIKKDRKLLRFINK